MKQRIRRPKNDSHRNAARYQRDNERIVELSIRGAELVRILAALSEEVEDVADGAQDASIQKAAAALSNALSEAVVLGAELTEEATAESVRRFDGQDCLPTRCAILSSKDARRIARKFSRTQVTIGT